MNLRPLFLFFTAALICSACSVYKSTGRKSFESKASGQISAASGAGVESLKTESAEHEENETCWSQLASEPLWEIDDHTPLIVTKLNDDEIQVCLQAP
jgi:hypothetical protein